eukprot:1160775-Pelagomonas_calceolata.AAC.9
MALLPRRLRGATPAISREAIEPIAVTAVVGAIELPPSRRLPRSLRRLPPSRSSCLRSLRRDM